MPPTNICGFVTTGPLDVGGEGVVGKEDESEQAARNAGKSAKDPIIITLLMFIIVEPPPPR